MCMAISFVTRVIRNSISNGSSKPWSFQNPFKHITATSLTPAARRTGRSGLQCPVEERQAHVHPVIDVRVVVVEFLVAVPDAGRGKPLRQNARAVMDVVLVAPAAVDV